VYDKTYPISDAKWESKNILRFEYTEQDTAIAKDIYLTLRHTGLYNYNNIFLFVTTLAPNGKSIKDTVEFSLAQTDGKWIGSGIGDVLDCRLAYKRMVKFGQQGKYIFYIQHGMRDLKLPEILDVGLRIEKSKD
jgi:gliding motility-associated lipoprotein GldH